MTMIDLHRTLERLRREKYSDLDPKLIAEIVNIQSDFIETPSEAYKRISQVLELYLQDEGTTSC